MLRLQVQYEDELSPILAEMDVALQDMDTPSRQAAEAYAELLRQTFYDAGVRRRRGLDWPPRQDNEPHPLLLKTGRLANSFEVLRARTGEYEVITEVPYAPVHHHGSPQRNIPARPFQIVSREDERVTQETIEGWYEAVMQKAQDQRVLTAVGITLGTALAAGAAYGLLRRGVRGRRARVVKSRSLTQRGAVVQPPIRTIQPASRVSQQEIQQAFRGVPAKGGIPHGDAFFDMSYQQRFSGLTGLQQGAASHAWDLRTQLVGRADEAARAAQARQLLSGPQYPGMPRQLGRSSILSRGQRSQAIKRAFRERGQVQARTLIRRRQRTIRRRAQLGLTRR